MPNIAGASDINPGVIVTQEVLSRGVSVPGGIRLAALLGEGQRVERLVISAIGGGRDGLDEDNSTAGDPDGRHFTVSFGPIVSNRLDLFKNGVTLTGLEQDGFVTSGSTTFSNLYDFRYDLDGNIELQSAALVDQGGAYFLAGSANVGNGVILGLTLVDTNAPTETWTVRVSSVVRDGYGDPIDGYGTFVVKGSISGIPLDGYGNQITWRSNGTTVSNGIISFSIADGAEPFVEGDSFTIRVRSGALVAGDSLTVRYIGEADLNDPVFFSSMNELTAKHGMPSEANTLSLGAQLAFANGTPGVFALQTHPSVPRRQSVILEEAASGGMVADDLTFALPLGALPSVDARINFFITDAVTGVETQIIPNKVDFYDGTITASPNTFHFGSSYAFSYTVVLEDAVVKEGDDGVITAIGPTTATLSSETVNFGLDDLSGTRTVQILHPNTNAGTAVIASVSEGVLTISGLSFTDEEDVEFRVIDSADSSTKVLFTDDLALDANATLRATFVDTKDAEFFDVGWAAAFAVLEAIECDIIVPLPSQTISQIFQNARIHVETMSQGRNRRERVLFIGAISGLTPENVRGTEPAAVEDIGVLEGIQGDSVQEILDGDIEDLTDYSVPDSFGQSTRVVYFYPDQIVVQIGADRTLIDGFYIAAAAAGYLSGIALVTIPLTNKVLAGFTILRDRLFRPLVLEQLSAAGICALQPAIGGGTVEWGKTTSQSGFAEDEEISIIFIRDRVAKSLRTAFRGFIGNAEAPTTLGSLISRANGVMQGFIAQTLITRFKDLTVARDLVEPRQWNITVRIQPTYPINWIWIKTSFGLLE